MKAAVDVLKADQDTPVLDKVAQALGEFGIYGKHSPCALPFYGVAMSVTRRLQAEQKEKKNEKRQNTNMKTNWNKQRDSKDPFHESDVGGSRYSLLLVRMIALPIVIRIA